MSIIEANTGYRVAANVFFLSRRQYSLKNLTIALLKRLSARPMNGFSMMEHSTDRIL
jgi:hypothetical protein